MDWFYNLRTKVKLLLIFTAICLFIVIMGVLCNLSLQQIGNNQEIMYHRTLLPTVQLEDAQAALLRMDSVIGHAAASKNTGDLEASVKDNSALIDKTLKEYKAKFLLSNDRKMISLLKMNHHEDLLKKEKNAYQALATNWPLYQSSSQTVISLLTLFGSGSQGSDSAGATDMSAINNNAEPLRAATAAFSELVGINKEVAGILYVESAQVAAATQRNTIAIIGLIIVLAGACGMLTARAITTPFEKGVGFVKALAEGDFTQRWEIKRQDEIGQFAANLNVTVEKISVMIRQIIENAWKVQEGSKEINSGNQDLSQRTEEQAASLEEIAATVEQMNSSIRGTADNSDQADKFSQTTLNMVRDGEKAVDETIEAMKQISASSRQIGEIIQVVNDIAFQTNLLALNAAVEAARAGEQGRGFAVVAAEVRNLAGRSAESSKEIEKLIKESLDRVERGNELVQRSGEMLRQIVQNTKHTSDIVVEIASAVKEQSASANQIQTAINQLNMVTQQNAALVEEVAASSDTMSSQAVALADMITAFHIRDCDGSRFADGSQPKVKLNAPAERTENKALLAGKYQEDDLTRF